MYNLRSDPVITFVTICFGFSFGLPLTILVLVVVSLLLVGYVYFCTVNHQIYSPTTRNQNHFRDAIHGI
nr:MAG TPA: hypothetical protein [Caudoviricetes sp.]DAP83560.1 MAG TPA: hypothetical protein [Caudoviricetes sp.]